VDEFRVMRIALNITVSEEDFERVFAISNILKNEDLSAGVRDRRKTKKKKKRRKKPMLVDNPNPNGRLRLVTPGHAERWTRLHE